MSREDISTLPPPMGFPQEEIYESSVHVSYYTCTIGPWLIFVFCPGGVAEDVWVIERTVNDPSRSHATQFFGHTQNSNASSWNLVDRDPLMLMAIIRDVTSESNTRDDTCPQLHPPP